MIKTFNTKTGKLSCSIEGSGQTLILIHGFGADSRIWDRVKPQLAQDFQLLIPDLPGFGHSELNNPENLRIEDMAESIRQVLTELKIENPILIGHSMGGYVGLAFQELFPGILRGLGLFHSHIFEDGTDRVGNRQKAIRFIQRNGSEYFIKEFFKTIFHEKFITEQPQLFEQYKSISESISPETLVAATYAMINRPDRAFILEDTQLPVLFIFGKHDYAMPLELCMQQVKLPYYSQLYILKNTGHMGMLEEPDLSISAIQQFAQAITVNKMQAH